MTSNRFADLVSLTWKALRAVSVVSSRVWPPRRHLTVVTVNWNSAEFLRVMISEVRRFSAPDVRILVVDNASRQRVGSLAKEFPGVRVIRLPRNLGHGRALDIGFALSRSTFVVALDVDAFPIRADWLETLLGPLQGGYTISGAQSGRGFVHPCCLAMSRDRFLRLGHSFRPIYGQDGELQADVGEAITLSDPGPVRLLEPSVIRGPGSLGTVFPDVVYHNFYSTRFSETSDELLDGAVSRRDARSAWQEALTRYGISG